MFQMGYSSRVLAYKKQDGSIHNPGEKRNGKCNNDETVVLSV